MTLVYVLFVVVSLNRHHICYMHVILKCKDRVMLCLTTLQPWGLWRSTSDYVQGSLMCRMTSKVALVRIDWPLPKLVMSPLMLNLQISTITRFLKANLGTSLLLSCKMMNKFIVYYSVMILLSVSVYSTIFWINILYREPRSFLSSIKRKRNKRHPENSQM